MTKKIQPRPLIQKKTTPDITVPWQPETRRAVGARSFIAALANKIAEDRHSQMADGEAATSTA